MTERDFSIDVVRRLREAGFEALWAGGCVRDHLMGHEPHDFDIATDARPEQVQRQFRRTIAVGASFGVIEVIGPRIDGDHLKVQVATFRSDGGYSDGRRPDSVTFCSSREDALRRDFTINGMFFDPLENRLIDYVGGQADLQAKVLRAIGSARDRFTEDKLRLLRAIRFAARFDLSLDPETAAAISDMAGEIVVVSAERIAEELRKLLTDRHRARGLRLLSETHLIRSTLPELTPLRDVPHGADSDLWRHTLAVIDHLPEAVSFPLALGALLHEIGKPQAWNRDRHTFAGHELAARDLANRIGERLRLSNVERERVEWLVERHEALHDAATLRPSVLKPILAQPGVEELLALHRADALAGGSSTLADADFAEAKLREWTASGELNPPPLLTGDDLKLLGLAPGPRFKKLLDAVRAGQLDGTLATAEDAKQLVRSLATP
jgi:tRNA nucleotidyltransferase/poly(A) polymerase